jgi:predicted nucleic-acid-binding protein
VIVRSLARKAAIAIGVATLSAIASGSVYANEDFSAYVDSRGSIPLPPDFRLSMVHLGSWFVPDGEASGFHDGYTEKETVEIYRKTGKFPDGATLVKELRVHGASGYTTGTGVSEAAPGFIGLVVLVETAWVLQRLYRASAEEIRETVTDLLGSRAIVVENRNVVARALALSKHNSCGFADAIIAASAFNAGCDKVISFDRRAVHAGMTLVD